MSRVVEFGRLFQKLAPETGKARLPTAERLNGGTIGWLEEVERSSLCLDGTSACWRIVVDNNQQKQNSRRKKLKNKN